MTTLPTTETEARQRWRRLQWQVRCAVDPSVPERIGTFVALAALLARQEPNAAVAVHRSTVMTLLGSGQDDALPRSWRAQCLDRIALPMVRLKVALGGVGAAELRRIDVALSRARQRLPPAPAPRRRMVEGPPSSPPPA